MRRTCPGCHLVLDRGEADYFIGGYVVNFVTAEFLIAAGAMVAILLTWPAVPWNTIKWSLILLMIPAPVLTYPFSKTVWLAIDLTLRPPTLSDLAGHGENEPDPDVDPVSDRSTGRGSEGHGGGAHRE